MDAGGLTELTPAARRRLYRRALLRPSLTVTVLVAAYYLLPLDRTDDPRVVLVLVAGMVAVACLGLWQVQAIRRSPYPAVQAVEALAAAVPLFLLLFAVAYWLLASSAPHAFSQPLSRTDALYFTVTVFATVGFGDISPVTEPARIAVTVQMVADLLVLGLLLRTITGAVRVSRAEHHRATVE